MTPSHTPRRTSLRWIWLALPISMLLTLGLIVVGVTGFIRLGRDARCLRDSLLTSASVQEVTFHKKFEVSAGALTFYALRAGLSFAPLEPEVRTALQSVRGAEVGVYHLNGSAGFLDRIELLAASDKAMAGRGWERVVGVAKEKEFMAVYVPKAQSASTSLQACVAVLNGRDLIVVSARTNLDPLIELACNKAERQHLSWHSVRL